MAKRKPRPQPAPSPPRRWKVELPYSPTLVVEARDQGEAWGLYMARCGLLGTIHTAKVTEVHADEPGKPA